MKELVEFIKKNSTNFFIWGRFSLKKNTSFFKNFILIICIAISLPSQAGWFSSRLDDFKELMKSGKLEEANTLVQTNSAYFNGLKDQDKAYVAESLGQPEQAILESLKSSLIEASSIEARLSQWSQLKAYIGRAKLEIVKADNMVLRSASVDKAIASLKETLDPLIEKLYKGAGRAFKDYGFYTSPSFVSVYPAEFTADILKQTLLDADFTNECLNASSYQLMQFSELYFGLLPQHDDFIGTISKLYVRRKILEQGALAWQQKRKIYREAIRNGFEVEDYARHRVLIVTWQETSDSGYQLEAPKKFPAIRLQQGVSAATFLKHDLAKQFDLNELDVVIFVRPLPVSSKRISQPTEVVSSSFISGSRQIANPDFNSAKDNVAAARITLETAQINANQAQANAGQSNLGAIAAAIAAGAKAAAEVDFQNAQRKLARTPQTISQDVSTNYTYQRTKTKVEKYSVVASSYYDIGTGISFGDAGSLDANSFNQTFDASLIEGVKSSDPNHDSILSGSTTLEKIDKFQSATIFYNYDAILPFKLKNYP